MKKILSLVLCFVLLSASVCYAAVSVPQSYSGTYSTIESYLTPGVFNVSSSAESDLMAPNSDNEIDSVEYTYQFTPIDRTNANAEIQFYVYEGEKTYPAHATGQVALEEYSSGEKLWVGPLEGSIEIEGTEYGILVGFTKSYENNEIQVGVTLESSISGNLAQTPPYAAFSFGGDVISESVVTEIISNAHEASGNSSDNHDYVENKEEYSVNSSRGYGSNTFALLDNSLAGFDTDETISGYGQRARLYFADGTGRVAIGSKSYCSNVENFYESKGTAVTAITEHTIGLKAASTDAYTDACSITGIEYSEEFDELQMGEETLIKGLFYDILSVLGVPTNTIDAMLGTLYGTASLVKAYENWHEVKFTYGYSQGAWFDDSAVGTPIVFSLVTGYTDSLVTYEYYTTYRYRTMVTYASSGASTFLYTDASPVSNIVDLQFRSLPPQ